MTTDEIMAMDDDALDEAIDVMKAKGCTQVWP